MKDLHAPIITPDGSLHPDAVALAATYPTLADARDAWRQITAILSGGEGHLYCASAIIDGRYAVTVIGFPGSEDQIARVLPVLDTGQPLVLERDVIHLFVQRHEYLAATEGPGEHAHPNAWTVLRGWRT